MARQPTGRAARDIKLTGEKQLQAAMEILGKRFNKSVAKPAVGKALSKIVSAVKKSAPVRFGYLKSRIKASGYKTRDGDIRGMVFVSKGVFSRTVGTRTLESRPTKYSHLVEFGTKRMRAKPFMIGTVKKAWGAEHEARLREELYKQVDKVAKRKGWK